MPVSIGINLRVTGHCSKGGRKYMEDFFSVAYQQTENEEVDGLEYAFVGIYDGHGGTEAAAFAKEHLMNSIVTQKLFWSDNDDDVLKAIKEGYISTHYSMWREQEKWPRTASGLLSTAGTTASIAFIRKGKIYIGHVGDSGIVLGFQREDDVKWNAVPLTEDHKPESIEEKNRIIKSGGKVVTKSGVPRVVWNRPKIGHKGPVRRSTPIDEIPFLAVARSLGDLWSYNSALNEFVVSPNPDVRVVEIDPKKFRCLIFGTDGLWNVLSPKSAVDIVRSAETDNLRIAIEGGREWKNPSKSLVNEALERWSRSNMKADNTSVVIVMLDPPGPPKRDVIKTMKTIMSTSPAAYDKTVGASYVQQTGNIGVTYFENSQKELVTDNQEPVLNEFSDQTNLLPTNNELMYMESFADTYIPLLNTSLNNDHSYVNYSNQSLHQDQYSHHDEHNEETYSLTNLQTKTEILEEGVKQPVFLNSSSNSTYFKPSGDRWSNPAIVGVTLPSNTTKYYCEPSGNFAVVENFHDFHNNHCHMQHSHNYPSGEHVSVKYHMERYDYAQQPSCSYIQNNAYVEPNVPASPSFPSSLDHCSEENVSEPDECIQINEISSSNLTLNEISTILKDGHNFDCEISEGVHALKIKNKTKLKKGIKNAVKFFYETRSKFQRRRIHLQENLQTPKFHQKRLSNKQTKVKKFLEVKRNIKRKPIKENLLHSNNNNNNNNSSSSSSSSSSNSKSSTCSSNSNNNNSSKKRVLKSSQEAIPLVSSNISEDKSCKKRKVCNSKRQNASVNVLSPSTSNIICDSVKYSKNIIITRNRSLQNR